MTGRGRSRAADDAITAAAVEELREHGYRGLTMSRVIDRAGVSSATLYRRFPTKQALVLATLQAVAAAPTAADTGSFAGDLDDLAKRIAKAIAARDDLFAVLSVELQFDDELRAVSRAAFVEPRLRQVSEMIDRAVARGELVDRPPADLVLSLVTGPITHRAFSLGEKLTTPFLRAVVRSVVAGLAPT